MKSLLISGLLMVAVNAQAAYPLQVSCAGKTADGLYSIKIAMKGLESANPATKRTEFSAVMNINATSPKGNLVFRNVKYRGNKLITGGGLVAYNINMEINQKGYHIFAAGLANKYDPLATFVDANVQGPEYHVKCTGVK